MPPDFDEQAWVSNSRPEGDVAEAAWAMGSVSPHAPLPTVPLLLSCAVDTNSAKRQNGRWGLLWSHKARVLTPAPPLGELFVFRQII